MPAVLVSAAGTIGGCAMLLGIFGSPPPPPPSPAGFGGSGSPPGGCLPMVWRMLALT